MSTLLTIFLLTLLAGLAMPFGALIASVEKIKIDWLEDELRHGVIAFGGGALLAAIALVLVPEGIKNIDVYASSFFFILGGFVFMALDIVLDKLKTSASQLMAMLSDFIPESLALGATFAVNEKGALLLAILIALQNIPEGFNAFRELKDSTSFSAFTIIFSFILMAILGPVAGLTGYLFLSDYPYIISAIMLFASGGILYSIFQDIAPQVPLQKHWAPPIGAVLGFVLGLVGYMITIVD